MNLALFSFLGLLTLVITANITSFVFHILNDRFYNPFHLAAGILAVCFFYSFTHAVVPAVVLTMLLGIAWELYEWCLWKYILKKKKYQPQPADTRNDLLLDFAGSLIGIALLVFWSS